MTQKLETVDRHPEVIDIPHQYRNLQFFRFKWASKRARKSQRNSGLLRLHIFNYLLINLHCNHHRSSWHRLYLEVKLKKSTSEMLVINHCAGKVLEATAAQDKTKAGSGSIWVIMLQLAFVFSSPVFTCIIWQPFQTSQTSFCSCDHHRFPLYDYY